MSSGVELWTVVGPSALLLVVALAAPLLRRSATRPREPTAVRLSLLTAVSVLPGVIVGDARLFAVAVALNLTLGYREFVPISKFGMFSTLPDKQTVIFLQDEGGELVAAPAVSMLQNQELTKIFKHAWRSCRAQNPSWSREDCDDVGAYFLNAALVRSAADRALGPPEGIRIMIAELECGPDGPVSAVRALRKVGVDE